MLDMNRKNSVWDTICEAMRDGGEAYRRGDYEHGSFCFGLAAGAMIRGLEFSDVEYLNRMTLLRQALKRGACHV